MVRKETVLAEVRASFRSEPRFGPHGHVELDFSNGTLIIEGEVPTVAAKKLLLEHAAAHPAVDGIVDRLHVAPLQSMGDSQIRNLVRDALLEEAALGEMAIQEVAKGETLTVREPPDRCGGEISIEVEGGIVTLDGVVPSLAHKRLAGVLAWWVPGTRDVINGLDVAPAERDTDEEVTDAVRMVLEKDPFVDASQISVTTKDCVVTLEGVVPKDTEREMAESDAWYVFGVDKVVNEIEVHPGSPTGRCG